MSGITDAVPDATAIDQDLPRLAQRVDLVAVDEDALDLVRAGAEVDRLRCSTYDPLARGGAGAAAVTSRGEVPREARQG
jgi:hypothetical protein